MSVRLSQQSLSSESALLPAPQEASIEEASHTVRFRFSTSDERIAAITILKKNQLDKMVVFERVDGDVRSVDLRLRLEKINEKIDVSAITRAVSQVLGPFLIQK